MAKRDHTESLLIRYRAARGGASIGAAPHGSAIASTPARHADAELRQVAEALPQLAWISDADGATLWHNRRWHMYTGSTPAQLAGSGWEAFCEPQCLPQIRQRWQQSLDSGQPFDMEFPLRGADGAYRWFHAQASPIGGGAGIAPRWFGTCTDVDRIRHAEEALRDETAVLELLNDTGNALASTRDLRSLLQEVTDAATRISGARYGAFFYNSIGDDGSVMQLCTLSGAAPSEFAHFNPPRATPLLGPGLRGEAVLRLADVLQDPRYGQWAPHHGMPAGHPAVRSFMMLPVVARSGEVIGTLLFGHPEPGMFTARSERILGNIAAQAAVAIDNTRLYEAAQRAADERTVLLHSERQARAQAERTSLMKDEFLATLSHELRTPLSAILGWAQVLRRGTRDEADLHRGLQTIERNARTQVRLIEDLLDMSRITSGEVELELQTLAPSAIVDAALEAMRPAALAKNIRLECLLDADAGNVLADPLRLQQVFCHLLSNALKFSARDGSVCVAARPAHSAGQVLFTVTDNGAGIAPAFLEHVFERFRQGDASTTRKHGGLGLGLAIVKHLVEQHGGTVGAYSAGEGCGASFSVQLPLAPLRQAACCGNRTVDAMLAAAPRQAGAAAESAPSSNPCATESQPGTAN